MLRVRAAAITDNGVVKRWTRQKQRNGVTKAAAQGHERDYKTLKVLEKNISRITY